MAEYIECRNCDSHDCKGCNLKNLETMLNNGKFDCLMNENRCINPAADVAPVRHGPCPYCDAKTNDFISINQTVEYSGIEIALNRQGMLRVRVYESGQETFTAQDIVEIKCCPNCGADMRGSNDE